MKNVITLLIMLASSVSVVVSIPAEKTAAAAAPEASVNEAANNGDKGIEAADNAALAVALAEAGDLGAVTTGAAFAAATAKIAKQDNASLLSLLDPAATPAAAAATEAAKADAKGDKNAKGADAKKDN